VLRLPAHPPKLFRAALIALLALGVVVRPMLPMLCEIGTVDHAEAAHAHAHGHAHAHAADEAVDPVEAHHHDDGELAQQLGAIDVAPLFAFVPVVHPQVAVPRPRVTRIPAAHASGPFRPPIA
jgi:predicted cobalt transporter CbtA